MKADTTLTITPAVIDEWEKDAVNREKQAAKLMDEAKVLRTRADAGKLLLGLPDQAGDATGAADDADGPNMMDAMAAIISKADKPMTRATMKSRLMTLGVPENQMASYFYTCVARLKIKKKISVTDDGKLWKGEES